MSDGVLELRLVVTATDYDEALRFYRDELGLAELGAFADGGGRVVDPGRGPRDARALRRAARRAHRPARGRAGGWRARSGSRSG